jgi:Ice-binding-like
MGMTIGRFGVAACVLVMCGIGDAWAQSSLGTAESFAVLAGSGVTNTGTSLLTGDLGTHPTPAVTGFPPGIVTGTIHAANATAAQAKVDLVGQYNALTAAACTSNLTGQNLGNRTLTPGVYCYDTSAQLTGTLTLDAQGNAAAQFIFTTGSSLTTASGSRVLLINGGNPCGVAWRVGTSATLGTTTSFIGNLIALTSITLTTDANIIGRALARNGAVTLDSNDITFAACGAVPPVPTLSQWMTILLAGLLCLTAIVALRKRQQVIRS